MLPHLVREGKLQPRAQSNRMTTHATMGSAAIALAEDVREGLSRAGQKELPSKYFYDEIGSALFEAISLLPEYGLTRADERLLREHAESIVCRFPGHVAVAELGSGSGKKTGWLLQAFCRRGPTVYYPIEISPAALAQCESELGKMEGLQVAGMGLDYLDGLAHVAARRADHETLLVLFLGSTIGNFGRAAGENFLRQVRQILMPGDALLLGTDLQNAIPKLISAYDDPLGVTAAFNLNLLARLNCELEADFDLTHFKHHVRFNSEERRIEMHLRSTINQTVTIPQADLTVTFQENETIWTESCHKYRLEEVAEMGARAGFNCDTQWVDSEWPFAESLLIAK